MSSEPSSQERLRFGITGVGGYIAPRHLEAIQAVGGELVAALDPSDSVGILDRYNRECSFFTEFERFDRHIEKLRQSREGNGIDYLSICSPNNLHDAHCRFGLRVGANIICEKPLVINPWNLDPLEQLEADSGKRIFTVLQLRHHPELKRVHSKTESSTTRHKVQLTYITARGRWYHHSWKGDEKRSGGVAVNIGIHFFDILTWLFGEVEGFHVHLRQGDKMSGALTLEKADVSWFLSLDSKDLPDQKESVHRIFEIDGQEIDLSANFQELHTQVYRDALRGQGADLTEARSSVQLVYDIRGAELSTSGPRHPLLK